MFFSRKKHEKEPQKAARCAVFFYVAMIQQIISELARLFDAERRNFLKIFITLAGDRMIIKKQRTKFVKKLQKACFAGNLSFGVDEKTCQRTRVRAKIRGNGGEGNTDNIF